MIDRMNAARHRKAPITQASRPNTGMQAIMKPEINTHQPTEMALLAVWFFGDLFGHRQRMPGGRVGEGGSSGRLLPYLASPRYAPASCGCHSWCCHRKCRTHSPCSRPAVPRGICGRAGDLIPTTCRRSRRPATSEARKAAAPDSSQACPRNGHGLIFTDGISLPE